MILNFLKIFLLIFGFQASNVSMNFASTEKIEESSSEVKMAFVEKEEPEKNKNEKGNENNNLENFNQINALENNINNSINETIQTSLNQKNKSENNNNKSKNSEKESDFSEFILEFEKYIEDGLLGWKSPGVSVAIISDNKIIYEKGFGVRKHGEKLEINKETIFQTMSLTKLSTSIVILQLVHEKKISLDDKLSKYFSSIKLNSKADELRIKDILSHTVGLTNFSGDSLLHIMASKEKIYHLISNLPVKNKPGEKYSYQNIFFGMLGEIIEKIEKKTLAKIYDERIFSKLNMKNSSIGPEKFIGNGLHSGINNLIKKFSLSDKNFASGHSLVNGEISVSENVEMPYVFKSTSGLNSTPSDYAKLIMCIMNDGEFGGKQIFNKELIKTLLTKRICMNKKNKNNLALPHKRMNPKEIYYCYGIFNGEYSNGGKIDSKKTNVFFHPGALGPGRSFWMYNKEKKIGIVVMSNLGSISSSLLPEMISYKFFDKILGFKEKNWNKKGIKQREKQKNESNKIYNKHIIINSGSGYEPNELVGKYENKIYGEMEITYDEKNLSFVYNNKKIKLNHYLNNLYEYKRSDLSSSLSDSNPDPNVLFYNDGKEICCIIYALYEKPNEFKKK